MSQPTAPQDLWTSTTSGSWSLAANWSLGRAPINGDNVVIDPTAPLTVTFDVANATLGGLTLIGATLTLQSGWMVTSGGNSLQSAVVNGGSALYLGGASTLSGLTLGGAAILVNRGAVTQSGGDVAIGDSTTSGSMIYNNAGSTWTISDASGMSQGGTTGWRFVNNGLLQKTSGTGLAWIRANFLSTGVIASATGGDIVIDGRLNRVSGTYIGAGMVDYGPDGVCWVGDVAVTQASCQSNFGVVRLTGVMTMYDGSTIMNAAGAYWCFAGDSSIVLAAGQAAGPDINGMGVIAKTQGTGTSHIGINAALEGKVSVITGTLSFEGASSAFSSIINGGGTFQIGAGAAQINAGAAMWVSNWTLAGGTTTLNENVAYAHAFTGEADASLDLGGHVLSLAQSANFSGLVMQGAGYVQASNGATISGLTVGGNVGFIVAAGQVVQSGGDVVLGDSNVADRAGVAINAGASWRIADASSILLAADPASRLSLSGTALLIKTGAGVSHVAPTINNSAANSSGAFAGIEVTAGTLDLQGAVNSTGSANIVGAATLEFDGAVAAGQTIDFSGAGGVLSLTDLADFHGQISGFDTIGSDDALLIGGGWSFAGASETTTAATLAFTNGAAHQSLTLLGDYTGGVFSAATVGGQLKITY
ncbi:MAG: hypothetical protein KGM15_16595 [Pseudomonadota bacterium]|nr:hypothetical protein [Pseudomonadota bacterium]